MLIDREKMNLNKLLEKQSFEYLRPPPQVNQIIIPQSQHFVQSSDGMKRKIYYRVTYTVDQIGHINEIRKLMPKYGIYQNLSDQLILKHLYATSMHYKNTLQRLVLIQSFHNNPIITTLTRETIQRLKSGCIYTYGQDINMKPIVILRADKFDTNLSVDDNFNAVYFLMLVVIGYRMVPYHCQKYINIIDLNNMSISNIPYSYMYDVLKKLSTFFCGNTQKTFVYHAGGFSKIWSLISKFIPQHSRKKVKFIDEGNQSQIFQYIDQYQLQKRFGGRLNDLTQFWPPKSTNEFDKISRNSQSAYTDFYTVINDNSYFKNQTSSFCSCGECSIY